MINRIKIRGYKTIKDLSFELKPINILIGSNGVGKSNFISFFKLVQNIYEQNLERFSMEEGAENLLRFGSKQTKEIYGYLEFDEANAYEFSLSRSSKDSLFIVLERIYSNTNSIGKNIGNHSFIIGRNKPESQIKSSKFILEVEDKVSKYLQTFQVYHFHDTSASAKIKQRGNVNDNRALHSDAGNLAAYLYYLQEKEPKAFKQIELTIRSVAPFFDRFILKPNRLKEDVIQLEWREKGSEMYLNASHISDGTLRFMALATLLLQPDTPEVIIIDEPELGLHPFAINKLAGLLRRASKKSQIIIATQSMNLIDNFEPEDILTIDRSDNQSVLKRLDSEQLKTWLDDYHSLSTLWNKNVLGGTP